MAETKRTDTHVRAAKSHCHLLVNQHGTTQPPENGPTVFSSVPRLLDEQQRTLYALAHSQEIRRGK